MFLDWWIGSCILLVLGAVFAIAAFALKYYANRNQRYKRRAEARVVEILAEPKTGDAALSEFRNRQVAVFEFFADGKLIKAMDKTVTYPCPYYMNQRAKIVYDPENPEDFEVLEENKWTRIAFGMNYMSIMCIMAGCLFFLMHAARIEL